MKSKSGGTAAKINSVSRNPRSGKSSTVRAMPKGTSGPSRDNKSKGIPTGFPSSVKGQG